VNQSSTALLASKRKSKPEAQGCATLGGDVPVGFHICLPPTSPAIAITTVTAITAACVLLLSQAAPTIDHFFSQLLITDTSICH
jgi:hypothetical protein